MHGRSRLWLLCAAGVCPDQCEGILSHASSRLTPPGTQAGVGDGSNRTCEVADNCRHRISQTGARRTYGFTALWTCLPLMRTLRKDTPFTFSTRFPLSTPAKSQSVREMFSIGALAKPRRYRAY